MNKKTKLILIICTVLTSIYVINLTSSRYLSSINTTDNVDVAMPRIILETPEISNNMLPGDTYEYTFYVKNNENNKINEVLMSYYVNINIENQDLPLTYEVYSVSNNQETKLEQNTSGYGPVTLDYGEEKNNQYKIIFKWAETENSVTYASKQFSFNIELTAEQIIY